MIGKIYSLYQYNQMIAISYSYLILLVFGASFQAKLCQIVVVLSSRRQVIHFNLLK